MIEFGVKGRFRLESIRCGEESVDHGWFDNMVLNNGLIKMLKSDGSGSGFLSIRPVCGTGNTAVLPTDTALAAFKAGGSANAISATTQRNSTVVPYHVRYTWVWQLPAGTAAGNISEVGIATTNSTPNSSTPLFSRALVTDSSGDPSSITVLADEILQITYELTVRIPDTTSGTFVQTNRGTPVVTSYTIIPANMQSSGANGFADCSVAGIPSIHSTAGESFNPMSKASSGAITNPDGTISGGTSWLDYISQGEPNITYYSRDITYGASLAQANISISAVVIALRMCAFQFSLSPAVSKTSDDIFRITFRVSISRV